MHGVNNFEIDTDLSVQRVQTIPTSGMLPFRLNILNYLFIINVQTIK
jgi:hypothetical protein